MTKSIKAKLKNSDSLTKENLQMNSDSDFNIQLSRCLNKHLYHMQDALYMDTKIFYDMV